MEALDQKGAGMTFEAVMTLTRTVSSATAFSDAECKALYYHCLGVEAGGLVVEIGCQLGRTSSIIAQVGKEQRYHSVHVDPYTSQPEYLVGWTRMMHGIGGCWVLGCMRTDQAEWLLAGRWIDLVFVDGDHNGPGVRTDCEILLPRVAQGGVALFHDYGHFDLIEVQPEVDRAIAASARRWERLPLVDTLAGWRRVG